MRVLARPMLLKLVSRTDLRFFMLADPSRSVRFAIVFFFFSWTKLSSI